MANDNFKLDVDADGIALVTWDMPGKTMNVIDVAVIQELGGIVEKIASDGAIKGAVITSGKDTFCGGADLTMLESLSHVFAKMAKEQGEEAAATAPAGRPSTTANSMPKNDSSSVAGNSVPNSVSTFWLVTSDVPKSPCSSCTT